MRKELVLLFCKEEYSKSLTEAKELVRISKILFEAFPTKYFYDFMSDSLMLAKSFIKTKDLEKAEESLLQIWEILNFFLFRSKKYTLEKAALINKNLDSKDLRAFKVVEQVIQNGNGHLKQPTSKNEQKKSVLIIFREIKRRSSLIATFANLFFAVGNLPKAEICYIGYIQLSEQFFGLSSLETSDCYYMVGIFYLENLYLKKSMACFRRSAKIRREILGNDHCCVSDCEFNIGIIYELVGRKEEGRDRILKSLQNFIEKKGFHNLRVAKVYQHLGGTEMQKRNFSAAMEYFNQTLSIYKKLGKDENDEPFYRIQNIIKKLSQIIENEKIPGLYESGDSTDKNLTNLASLFKLIQEDEQEVIENEDQTKSLKNVKRSHTFTEKSSELNQENYNHHSSDSNPSLEDKTNVSIEEESEQMIVYPQFEGEEEEPSLEEKSNSNYKDFNEDENLENRLGLQISKMNQSMEYGDHLKNQFADQPVEEVATESDDDTMTDSDEENLELMGDTDPILKKLLTKEQMLEFKLLKTSIFKKIISKSSYHPLDDILTSELFETLSQNQINRIELLNPLIFT